MWTLEFRLYGWQKEYQAFVGINPAASLILLCSPLRANGLGFPRSAKKPEDKRENNSKDLATRRCIVFISERGYTKNCCKVAT